MKTLCLETYVHLLISFWLLAKSLIFNLTRVELNNYKNENSNHILPQFLATHFRRFGLQIQSAGEIYQTIQLRDSRRARSANVTKICGSSPSRPADLCAVRESGAVNEQVTIGEGGNVIAASAVSGHPLLRASAVSAARESKFSPTLLSGKAVKVSGVIVYNFTQ